MDGDGQGARWDRGEAGGLAVPLDASCPLPSRPPEAAVTGRDAPRLGMGRSVPLRRLALVLLILAALALGMAALVGREVAAPAWLAGRVAAQAGTLLGEGSLRIGAITLAVGRDLHPRVRLRDVELRDGGGRPIARVPDLAATLSPRGLLGRRALVEAIRIRGAEVSISQAADGSVALVAAGDGSGEEAGRRGLASIPERLEGLLAAPALAALRQVSVEGLVINYEDARAGRTWTLDGGTLALDLSDAETRLRGQVSLLSGRTYATVARIDYRGARTGPAAELALTLTDVAAADVASQAPALAWLGVVDAPISLALRASLDRDGRLGPLRAALKIAGGELRPPGGAPPVRFDLARAYLSFDPDAQRIDFSRLEVRSEWGSVLAGGRAWLGEAEAGMPRALVGQLDLREVVLSPPGLHEAPLRLTDAAADLRLRLDPFALEVAQVSAVDAGAGAAEGLGRILASGRVGSSPEGWSVAVDARLPEASRDRLLQLWPEGWRTGLRDWLVANVTAGRFTDATVALRSTPGAALRLAATTRFDGAVVRPLATHPPIRDAAGRLAWDTGALSVALERGWVEAARGGAVDLAGTALTVPAGGGPRPPARVDVAAEGSITAALWLLDVAPLSLVSSAGLPVDLARGRARIGGTADIFLGAMAPDEARYRIAATLSGVATDVLVPGRTLTADRLTLAATEEGVAVDGPVRLGGIAATGRWSERRDAPGASRVEAEVAVTPAALAELGIALPDGAVSGEGVGSVTLDLLAGEAPRFAFSSTLEGLGLGLPELGWSKGPQTSGELTVEGRLGAPVRVDRLALTAPGLSAEGSLAVAADGSFDRLDLDRLQVGGWLDAAVTLRSRGPAAVPGVEVRGGELDLREAAFGSGGEGEGGPISVRLDRLEVTDAIALTDLSAELSTEAGIEGTFRGLVNGAAEVTGRVAPQGGRVGARIQGTDAGAVMRAANLVSRAEGGALDVLLLPADEASYDGEAYITDLRVRDAPVLASLLNAVSVVGLLQQLGGQGIVFEEVAASFRIDPERITVNRSSAVGVGLGLSMDGTYDIAADVMDLRGVFSPLYLINGIGQVFSQRGEGLIGFNYTLRGSAAAPEVGVNPLSALTPGMFRNIFRRAATGQ